MVRAKFKVISKDVYGCIKLQAVYSKDPNHENKKFWDATPSASLEMTITNPETAALFGLGQEYYVDFTKAEGPSTS